MSTLRHVPVFTSSTPSLAASSPFASPATTLTAVSSSSAQGSLFAGDIDGYLYEVTPADGYEARRKVAIFPWEGGKGEGRVDELKLLYDHEDGAVLLALGDENNHTTLKLILVPSALQRPVRLLRSSALSLAGQITAWAVSPSAFSSTSNSAKKRKAALVLGLSTGSVVALPSFDTLVRSSFPPTHPAPVWGKLRTVYAPGSSSGASTSKGTQSATEQGEITNLVFLGGGGGGTGASLMFSTPSAILALPFPFGTSPASGGKGQTNAGGATIIDGAAGAAAGCLSVLLTASSGSGSGSKAVVGRAEALWTLTPPEAPTGGGRESCWAIEGPKEGVEVFSRGVLAGFFAKSQDGQQGQGAEGMIPRSSRRFVRQPATAIEQEEKARDPFEFATPEEGEEEEQREQMSPYVLILSPPTQGRPTLAHPSATVRAFARNDGQQSAEESDSGVAKLTIFDTRNKFVAFSSVVPLPQAAQSASGKRAFVWETKSAQDDAERAVGVFFPGAGGVLHLTEQAGSETLSALCARGLWSLAVGFAESRPFALKGEKDEVVADVWRRYGDHLYAKGDPGGAMGCYAKTVGWVQPSYVIRKFLDAQRIAHLTSYLQELHSRQLANEEHTTLLLNCYTKLGDEAALSAFLHSSATPRERVDGSTVEDRPPFDLETAIRVCRQAGYFEHAVWLAERYDDTEEYLRIQVEDRHDFRDALRFLQALGKKEGGKERMEENARRYGKRLVDALPTETTGVLVDICTGGKEWVDPAIKKKERAAAKKKRRQATDQASAVDGLAPQVEAMSLSRQGSSTGAPPASTPSAIRRSGLSQQQQLDAAASEDVTEDEQDATPSVPLPSPRQFFAHYVDHPSQFIVFLESIARKRWGKSVQEPAATKNKGGDTDAQAMVMEGPLPEPRALRGTDTYDTVDKRDEQAVWNTLLELYLTSSSSSDAGDGTATRQELEAKAMRLLKSRDSIEYDEAQALLVCVMAGFTPGIILLYEQLGMYDDIVQYWVDLSLQDGNETQGFSRNAITALKRYGSRSRRSYETVLRFLTTSSDLLARHQQDVLEILEVVETEKLLQPVTVVQILSANGTASVGLVREYLKKHLLEEREEIASDRTLISSYRTETAAKKKEIQELSDPKQPRTFQITRCSACGGHLDVPSVHFMCKHSYHQRCLPETDSHCPNCARTHGVVQEIRRGNERFASQPELFLAEIEHSEDTFATIASAYGKGLIGMVKEE